LRVVFGFFLVLLPLLVSLKAEVEVCLYKHSLKCNMNHIHEETPRDVQSLQAMFGEGVFYNRLRFNSFAYEWERTLSNDEGALRQNHAIAGVGGSVIYRSAYLDGFAFGFSLYGSQALGTLDRSSVGLYKAGKDLFSRYETLAHQKSLRLLSLAEVYGEYKLSKSSLKVGRQIFETLLTKSNDTKMIPNTFEGVTLTSKMIPATTLKLGYLTKQKLRDHNTFHHLLAYGDDPNDPFAHYTQNDDAVMHRGLTLSKLQARGIEDRLWIAEVKSHALRDINLFANYTSVPKLLSFATLQANYRIELDEWSMIPAVRYMQQFDKGAGAIGGANYYEVTRGYRHSDSLDAQMLAARVDFVRDSLKLRLGYSDVADKGDFITPWRGFPTGGFSRGMGQYNWHANTKSYMVQVDYECEEIPDLKFISRFVAQDFDDEKQGVQADSNLFSFDMLKVLDEKKLYLKTRYAHVVGDANSVTSYGFQKLDPSYDEFRIELNYLF
jgi:hypothetical protein